MIRRKPEGSATRRKGAPGYDYRGFAVYHSEGEGWLVHRAGLGFIGEPQPTKRDALIAVDQWHLEHPTKAPTKTRRPNWRTKTRQLAAK